MTDDSPDTFAKALRRQRDLLGLSVTEVARRVGKTQSYMSQLENGALGVPDDDRIEDIARAMQIDPDPLFRAAGRLPPRVRNDAFKSWVNEPELTEKYLRESASGTSGLKINVDVSNPNAKSEE